MDFIKWDESFSVGVRMIDAQHQKLFEIINKLHKEVSGAPNGEFEPLENMILQLAAYVDFHFRTEEKFFKEFNYEKSEKHIHQHKIYTDKIRDFNERYKKGEEKLGEDIMKFLEHWIMNHIKINDKEYIECFHEHGLY